jgi:uncharacterized protein YbaR (Trm112 family)
MYALDLKRCPHCAAALDSLTVDETRAADASARVMVCRRCDAAPRWDQAEFVPRAWSDPLR